VLRNVCNLQIALKLHTEKPQWYVYKSNHGNRLRTSSTSAASRKSRFTDYVPQRKRPEWTWVHKISDLHVEDGYRFGCQCMFPIVVKWYSRGNLPTQMPIQRNLCVCSKNKQPWIWLHSKKLAFDSWINERRIVCDWPFEAVISFPVDQLAGVTMIKYNNIILVCVLCFFKIAI